MDDATFQTLSVVEKAKVLGLSPWDDGKTEWRAGDMVWYRPRRGRKWRKGTVTYSKRCHSRGKTWCSWDMVRVDWVLVAEGCVSRERPERLCPHDYEPGLWECRHPCPRCKREYWKRQRDVRGATGEMRQVEGE